MKTMTSRDDRATITAMMGVSSDCVFWSERTREREREFNNILKMSTSSIWHLIEPVSGAPMGFGLALFGQFIGSIAPGKLDQAHKSAQVFERKPILFNTVNS